MRKIVTVKGMLKHENAFQSIADANGGTRVAGTAGYDQSVDYVVKKLKGAGYKPVVGLRFRSLRSSRRTHHRSSRASRRIRARTWTR